jgi:hypothetical protein
MTNNRELLLFLNRYMDSKFSFYSASREDRERKEPVKERDQNGTVLINEAISTVDGT